MIQSLGALWRDPGAEVRYHGRGLGVQDVWILILHLLTLLNSFINSNRFLWGMVSYIMPYHLQRGSFTSLPTSHIFITFSCLIALAKIPNTLFNKSGGSRHPCLVLDLNRKSFQSFTTEYNVSCRLLIYILYHVELCLIYTHIFIINRYLPNAFLLHLLRWSHFYFSCC